MKNVLITTAVAVAACLTVNAAPQAPQADGLSDLNAMTFGCPTAALECRRTSGGKGAVTGHAISSRTSN